MKRSLWMLAACAVALPSAFAAEKPQRAGRPTPSAEACALLDNPKIASRMDGLLRYLAIGCGREAEFIGGVRQDWAEPFGVDSPEAADVVVSNPAMDTSGTAKTQSETSIALNETTGTLCGAWNDSFHGVTQGVGFSGYGRSTNNGATWTDFGAVNPTSNFDDGDPSLVWRKSDGNFYYAALNGGGLALYRSTDDCQTFVWLSTIATSNDDKEIMAVDNTTASPRYGRLYVAWTDFTDARIYSTYSDNGTTWSAQLALSASGVDVQGAWPVVAPNGDVFVAWVAWIGAGYPNGNLEVQIARSTNGGTSYALVTPPMTNQTNPREAAATSSCGRPALAGNIRYLPSPQIAVDAAGVLHAVYTYDPDATASGDAVNVYYRRSTDSGATWQPEVKINDNDESVNPTDQFFPSLSVGAGNVVAVGYYSKQNNVDNLHLDYYSRVSYSGGASWQPSTRLSDVSSTVVLDPNLATCYHGDYDTQIHRPGAAQYLWSDDRDPGTGANPNIYTESTPAGVDFLVSASPTSQLVCAGTVASYPLNVFQFQGFTEPVMLSVTGAPAGTTPSFTINPVAPGGTSTMNVTTGSVVVYTTATLTVTGTSSPSSIVHSTPVDLTVYVAAPGVATLTAPANGAIGQPIAVTFTWSAVAGAASYLLEVDDDSAFGSINFTTTVTAPTANATGLLAFTKYYWRVRPTNPCGSGSNSAVFNFTTAGCSSPNVAIPDDNPTGVTDTLVVPSGYAISDLNVSITATHTWVGDLIFTLTNTTTATSVIVIDRPGVPASTYGCSADNIAATLDDEGVNGPVETMCSTTPPALFGTPTPNNPLTAFDGQAFAGTWALKAVDAEVALTGTLVQWCLLVSSDVIFKDGFQTP